MQNRQVAGLCWLLVLMTFAVAKPTCWSAEGRKTETTLRPNKDERANRRNRTEVPIPEIGKWGRRPIKCHFVVINDTHVRPAETRGLDKAMARLQNQVPDFVVFIGDLTFGQGESETIKQDSFKTLVETAQKVRRPSYFGLGNTDVTRGSDPFRAFRELTHFAPYYSFDSGGVHFVMLYTEQAKPGRFGTVSGPQLKWLKSDLESMTQGSAVVLFGHHPLYPDEKKWERDNWGIDNAPQLFEILEPYHLIATFSGHRHLNRMNLDKRGVLHVINGAMVNDHSDDIGPKKDGIGYRWVTLTDRTVSTTWIPIGTGDIPR